MLRLDIVDGSCLTITNTEIVPIYEGGKLICLDIKACLADGALVNIEIQLWDRGDTIPRVLYYNDRSFVSQLEAGDPYHNLHRTISLVILDFELLRSEKNWYNTYQYRNVETGTRLTNLKELIFVELPKWKALQRSPQEILSPNREWDAREKWSLFLSTEEGEGS